MTKVIMSHIGTLNEKPLHASLKEWYARPGDRFEVRVDRFVIDIVRDDLLLEIQTASLSSMKVKLAELVKSHRVHLIYPIAQVKHIVKAARDGAPASTRRSPKRGRAVELFREMVSFPELIAHPNFTLEVLLTREEEVRRAARNLNWRRRGWRVEERRLLEVLESRHYREPSDWRAFVPKGRDCFTTAELAGGLAIPRDLAQKTAYCLRKAGVIRQVGRRGRANLYSADRGAGDAPAARD